VTSYPNQREAVIGRGELARLTGRLAEAEALLARTLVALQMWSVGWSFDDDVSVLRADVRVWTEAQS
jgi:hypothetical protein